MTGRRSVVLFVCIQNAGRSQMAQAFLERAAADRVVARSAGSRPAARVHPEVVEVMKEVGIDLADREPQGLSADITAGVDLVVTMGCGDECPFIAGARVVDWDLDDPSGRPIEDVRKIRDDIEARVSSLLAEVR
ncbi:MAG: arsenate reductase ArsC [Actinobacteria bacterium]|nr:arsenate reductase ArsC [Actinomycetota bacterium]